MSSLTTFDSSAPSRNDMGAESHLVQAQNLLAQAISQNLLAQAVIQKRLDTVEENVAALAVRVHDLASNSSLITVVQLEVMLGVHWNEATKQEMGMRLARYSRHHNTPPRKVPHPTLAGGVNGYEPSIVKAWIEEETEYKVPDVLRYVP